MSTPVAQGVGRRRHGSADHEMGSRIEPVLPAFKAPMGRPVRDHRSLPEGSRYRYRTGSRGVICRRSCGAGDQAEHRA